MKINIKAHPRSKFEKIIEHEGFYHCYFNVAPVSGQANLKIIKMLADFFNVPKSNITLLNGKTNTEKLFEIKD